jgi:hypothetical protein
MNNSTSNKKQLSPEQREELLGALEARFEKNMNRHKGLDWAKVQAKLEGNAEKLWSLLKAAPVFVTTGKGLSLGKNINRKTPPWIWQRPWALSF